MPDCTGNKPPCLISAYRHYLGKRTTLISKPRFDGNGDKIQNARITLRHNGVTVHRDYEIVAKTGAGKPETPELRPIKLQDHGNPVVFRNIWIVLKNGVSETLPELKEAPGLPSESVSLTRGVATPGEG